MEFHPGLRSGAVEFGYPPGLGPGVELGDRASGGQQQRVLLARDLGRRGELGRQQECAAARLLGPVLELGDLGAGAQVLAVRLAGRAR
jgi:hypothetical protein